ncbi:MAG: GNAT family N-acyltransferase [Crocinitomicaceae bacterium]
MKEIIPPVDINLLQAELNQDRFVRKVRNGDAEIYIVNQHNAPNVLKEIGRLREETFRAAGGGTGEELDLDEQDLQEKCYDQLIVWSPTEKGIISGYRFFDCSKISGPENIHQELSSSHYFNFSDEFITKYLPQTIELGRSWVRKDYQPQTDPRKGLYALANLWDGLGALVKNYPHIDYFFGKVTMYTNYDSKARDAVLYFMKHYFPDPDKLVVPKHPLESNNDISDFKADLQGKDFKDGMRELIKFARSREELVPPLIKSYMQLSPTMKTFGTCHNSDFGGVEETGIMIKISEIYEDKTARHVEY